MCAKCVRAHLGSYNMCAAYSDWGSRFVFFLGLGLGLVGDARRTELPESYYKRACVGAAHAVHISISLTGQTPALGRGTTTLPVLVICSFGTWAWYHHPPSARYLFVWLFLRLVVDIDLCVTDL